MQSVTIRPQARVEGEITVPGDKSITQRTIILGALAQGQCRIRGYLRSDDCLHTADAFRRMGVEMDEDGGDLVIHGVGLDGLQEPTNTLYLGNSGTGMRLLLGVLAGQPFFTVVNGDQYLNRRPMDRVVAPLTRMGARIWGRDGGRLPPLAIQGGDLRAIEYDSPIASAQVKTCILLAGLFAVRQTVVHEPAKSRDHTERLLRSLGVDLQEEGLTVALTAPQQSWPGFDFTVPGDFSSAAYPLIAALILPDSRVTARGVGLNPTRTGLLDALRDMDARIEVDNVREVCGEPVGDLTASTSDLKGSTIGGDLIPRTIDDLLILAVAAALAKGETIIRDAAELRVKESDRIHAITEGLNRLGASVEESEDGLRIQGPASFRGATCQSFGDHRIAMSLAVAALTAAGTSSIADIECVNTSFPGFFGLIQGLAGSETFRFSEDTE